MMSIVVPSDHNSMHDLDEPERSRRRTIAVLPSKIRWIANYGLSLHAGMRDDPWRYLARGSFSPTFDQTFASIATGVEAWRAPSTHPAYAWSYLNRFSSVAGTRLAVNDVHP